MLTRIPPSRSRCVAMAVAALAAAGSTGCGDRDALLPPGEQRERTHVELLGDGAVVRVSGPVRGPVVWSGGRWVLQTGAPPALVRVDEGIVRRVLGAFDHERILDFRLLGGQLIFRLDVAGGFAVDELWRFDPDTAIAIKLPGHGVDKLVRRPGHDTFVVRGWTRSDASGEPDLLRIVDAMTGLAIRGEASVRLYRPPAEPARVYLARPGETVRQIRSALGGAGLLVSVASPDDEPIEGVIDRGGGSWAFPPTVRKC